jgi:hypothetical protein
MNGIFGVFMNGSRLALKPLNDLILMKPLNKIKK